MPYKLSRTQVKLFTEGVRGSGKTTILKFVFDALGDFTGVRRTLRRGGFPSSVLDSNEEHLVIEGNPLGMHIEDLSTEQLLDAYKASLRRAYKFSEQLKIQGIEPGRIRINLKKQGNDLWAKLSVIHDTFITRDAAESH